MSNNLTPSTALNGHSSTPVVSAPQADVSVTKTVHAKTKGQNQLPFLDERVAAQAQTPESAGRGDGNLNDSLPRPLDKDDLPVSRPQVFLSPGLLAARPLADTRIGRLVEKIAETFPVRAERLAVAYEEGLRFNKSQLDDLDRLGREELQLHNEEVERRNAALEQWQAALEVERDAKCAQDNEALRQLEEPLAQAHGEAAKAVAKTGGDYDASNPLVEAVLREQPLPLEVVAGGAIPWTANDNIKRVPEWIQMVLKIGVGAALGLSIGFMPHILSPDALGAKPAELLGCLFLGFVVALGGGWAIRTMTRRASERYWMARFGGYGPLFWVPSLAVAVVTGLTLMGAEATIEMRGLLASAQLEQLNGGKADVPALAMFVIGLIFTVGYLVTMAGEGSLDGRSDVCLNHVRKMQYEEFQGRQKAEREDERVQTALEKLGLVRELIRQWHLLETRIATAIAPYNEKIAFLEHLKQLPQSGLSLEARHLLRTAYDNWCGSNGDWHADLNALIQAIEPLPTKYRSTPVRGQGGNKPGLWKRLAHWWRNKRSK